MLSRDRVFGFLLVCVVFGSASHAAATTLGYLDQSRSVWAWSLLPPEGSSWVSAPDFGPFVRSVSESATSAFQDSVLGDAMMQARLTASTTNDETQARSSFAVDFTLDQSVAYSLSGSVDGTGTSVVLRELGGATIFEILGVGDGYGENVDPFDVSGVLAPGSYQLDAFADASYPITMSPLYIATEVLFVVPEPASAWLVALGLVLLGLRRR